MVMCDILKNHLREHSEDITGHRCAQRSCHNEHSDTHGFCPKVLSNLRPDKTIECVEQGHGEEASSCQSKQHMMDVTCSN